MMLNWWSEKTPSSRRPLNIESMDYLKPKISKSSREETEKPTRALKFWEINSREKLVLSSPTPPRPQSTESRKSSKPTRLLPQLRLVWSLTWTLLSQQDQLVWNPPKFLSSTPLTFLPRLTRDKSKSLRIIQCVLLEEKLDPLRLLFSKKWTLSHSHIKWTSLVLMMMDLFLMLLPAKFHQMKSLDSSNKESRTWLLSHYKPDMLLNCQLPTLSRMPSRIWLLLDYRLITNLLKLLTPKLKLLLLLPALSQPNPERPRKNKNQRKNPKKKKKETSIWEIYSVENCLC